MNTDKPVFRIFVISDFNGSDANVVRDYLFCFNRNSRHEYYYIFDPGSMTEFVHLNRFDVILLFWNLYLPGSKLSNRVREKIRQSQALKVLFLQDEYRDVHTFNRLMDELGVQVMFTCVAEKDHAIFYPTDRIPTLQAAYTVLTGYAPAYLQDSPPPEKRERPIDIGYRSRSLPFYLGDLGREKTIVAERFLELSGKHGFTCDISVNEGERIYGRQWVEFLRASRFTLGSPSGASVIDFTGSIRRNCEDHLGLHPDATYAEVKGRFFADVDGKVVIDTVSPRIFESAALGCTMVMHEGYYGGILLPGRHFISIKKDYSNIDEVFYQMKDQAYAWQIAANAHNDLIASGEYSYKRFVQRFDGILDDHISSTGPARIAKPGFYGNLYLKSGQAILPSADRFIFLPGRKTFEFFRRARLLGQSLGFVSLHPTLRRLLFFHLHGRYWKKIPFKSLLMDLSRFGILYGIARIRKTIRARFWVGVRYLPEWPRLSFTSLAPDGVPVIDAPGFELHQFVDLIRMKGALLDWDHSQIGTHLEFNYRERTFSLDMGEGGRYRFGALAGMSKFCPDLIADLLDSMMSEMSHG